MVNPIPTMVNPIPQKQSNSSVLKQQFEDEQLDEIYESKNNAKAWLKNKLQEIKTICKEGENIMILTYELHHGHVSKCT